MIRAAEHLVRRIDVGTVVFQPPPSRFISAAVPASNFGVNATFGMGMPYQHHATLRRLLPGLELVEVTAELAALRAVKSDEELRWLRRAAELTDRAVEALRAEVRPGIPEYALLGIVEGAYRSDGGLPHIAFLRSMPMAAPNGCLPAQNPSGRVLRQGDIVEIAECRPLSQRTGIPAVRNSRWPSPSWMSYRLNSSGRPPLSPR